MRIHELDRNIRNKEARLAVIGLGYVGLPVACVFAEAGFDVLGVEISESKVACINRGISPVKGNEPGLAKLVSKVVADKNFRATTNYKLLSERDVILIAVETPVDGNKSPDYTALLSVITDLGKTIQQGALVIVESTVAPGTMDRVISPLLEEVSGLTLNRDFLLGNCPERVMPGRLLSNLRSMNRVVGGMTPETSEVMVSLYSHIVNADLDPADCITAELVKTVENAYRDVQIAFANEVSLICEANGANVWAVRHLVNKSPGREMLLPGAGVGGHCIPKDPWLLVHGAEDIDQSLELIPSARSINDSMPLHIIRLLRDALRTKNRDINESKVLVLGYAYLEDSDDTRNSPSKVLTCQLEHLGANVVIHDPYIDEYCGSLVDKAVQCDAIVVMVGHSQYRDLDLAMLRSQMRTTVLVDGRNVIDDSRARNLGFVFRGIGRGDLFIK